MSPKTMPSAATAIGTKDAGRVTPSPNFAVGIEIPRRLKEQWGQEHVQRRSSKCVTKAPGVYQPYARTHGKKRKDRPERHLAT